VRSLRHADLKRVRLNDIADPEDARALPCPTPANIEQYCKGCGTTADRDVAASAPIRLQLHGLIEILKSNSNFERQRLNGNYILLPKDHLKNAFTSVLYSSR
jgi:hypothetical protein